MLTFDESQNCMSTTDVDNMTVVDS